MTPALRTETPHVLTDSPDYGGGKAGKYWPAGRVCAAEDCTTILRRSNPGPLCDPCQEKAKAARRARDEWALTPAPSPKRKRGAPASAAGASGTNAAPAPRKTKREELELAGEHRSKSEAARQAIVDLLSDGEWHHVSECAVACGLGRDNTNKMLQKMDEVESGGRGGPGYRLLPPRPDDKKDSPADPTGEAPAEPDPPRQEQANEAAGSEPLQGPPPFAGMLAGLQPVQVSQDPEVLCLARLIAALEELPDPEARRRNLAHIAERYMVDLAG